MEKDAENLKPGLVLRKKYREEMEALNLTIGEYLEMRREAEYEQERLELEKYLQDHPAPVPSVKIIPLIENVKNMKFERRFFTREDAEFVKEQQDKWEEEHSIWEPIELSTKEEEDLLQALVQTGVRYDFANIGVSIFATWEFNEQHYDGGDSYIDYGYIAYYYNHFSGEFKEINAEDFFKIDFVV